MADPQLAVTHLRIRALRNIEMAEHGVEFAHRGLPSPPCAHVFFFLGVASHPRVVWFDRIFVGSWPLLVI